MNENKIAKKADQLLNIGAQAYQQGNYEKAKEYYKKSVDLGQSEAACNLGYIYAYGRTGNRDHEKAFYYFNLAAIDGNANASYKIGDAYYWGDFVKKTFISISILPSSGITIVVCSR